MGSLGLKGTLVLLEGFQKCNQIQESYLNTYFANFLSLRKSNLPNENVCSLYSIKVQHAKWETKIINLELILTGIFKNT